VRRVDYKENVMNVYFTCDSIISVWFMSPTSNPRKITKIPSTQHWKNTIKIPLHQSDNSGSYYCYGFHSNDTSFFFAEGILRVYGKLETET